MKLSKYLADYIEYEQDNKSDLSMSEIIENGIDAYNSVEFDDNLLDDNVLFCELSSSKKELTKTYIFLTVDGQTVDGAGNDVENCQLIDVQEAESPLDAYNKMLREKRHNEFFDSCFCYELANEKIYTFDLINDSE